jgi:hypothetical protein
MQTRLITETLLFMIEEAFQPENAQRVFIVCLTCICPAKLLTFLTEVAITV